MSNPSPFAIRHRPVLDPDFLPAIFWNRHYRSLVAEDPGAEPLGISLDRGDGTRSVFKTRVLSPIASHQALNRKYVERLLKFLLWQRGGCKITIGGSPLIADMMRSIYSPLGERAFDAEFIGQKVYGRPMSIECCTYEALPEPCESSIPLGRNLDGCRIGFDLGGSDRKCAALIDGKVIFSEEVPWNPYFESNPQYHFNGINDSLRRAAAQLPRVDAIGGSSAGVYVRNEVRVASLFRGVSKDDFDRSVRHLFFRLKEEWNGIPLEVVNDGEVTALAGSLSLRDNHVLGLSMGTSQASGYVDDDGHILPWLNELAFAPIDYRDDAPVDEWSGDIGCGVQYFSQQAVVRLARKAALDLKEGLPFAEVLVEVQKRMEKGDVRARSIYETIGAYLGYTIAHYAEFYELRNLLILGRVTSGDGGAVILEKAEAVLRDEFPDLAACIRLRTPNEQDKRHGQAIAAASLPKLEKINR